MRKIQKVIGAIGRPVVAAAAESTGCHAIIVGIARHHLIIVIVVQVFEAQAEKKPPGIVDRDFKLTIGSDHKTRYVKIVMPALRERFVEESRIAVQWFCLKLLDETVGVFEVESARECRGASDLVLHDPHQATADLAIFFQRLAGNKVLQKFHI